ncbi:uncharacterized protein METZ01_LOCUS471603, partial [marine metagenome]
PIDLTVGSIDSAVQQHTVARITKSIKDIGSAGSAAAPVIPEFQKAFSSWFARRFDVDLNPETQVLPLTGAKTGVACAPLALVNPGETVLVPDPAYPAYRTAAIMAGGYVHTMPLVERNDFLPNMRQVDAAVAHEAKLMFISYPNNPTGSVTDIQMFREIVEFARQHNIIVCHDATHALMNYDDYEAPSLLQAPGGNDVGFEIFSLSVLFGGAPWELGVAVGNPSSLAALAHLTNNMDSTLFPVLQQ